MSSLTLGARDTLRSVKTSVKKKAKDTFGRFLKHLKSEEDVKRPPRRRKSIPLLWNPRIVVPESPTVSSSSTSTEIPRRDSVLSDSGYASDAAEPNPPKDGKPHPGPSNMRNNKPNARQTPKLTSKKINSQFAELCALVNCDVKMDKLRAQRGHHSSSADEMDDSIAPDLREYLEVPIRSFKSVDSLRKITTATRRVRAIDRDKHSFPSVPRKRSVTTVHTSDSGPLFRIRSMEIMDDESSRDTSSLEDYVRLEWEDEAGEARSTLRKPSTAVDYLVAKPHNESTCRYISPPSTIAGIDSEENVDPMPSVDPKPIPIEENLHEGFDGFFTTPASGLRSLIRTHGKDFYEYPRDPPKPPPRFETRSTGPLEATCALYDVTHFIGSSQTDTSVDLKMGADRRQSISLSPERDLELARVSDQMHDRGLPSPQWKTFHVKTSASPAATESKPRTIRWKDLGDLEATNLPSSMGFTDLTDVAYRNDIDRFTTAWRWEANASMLFRLQEQPCNTATVERVQLNADECLSEQLSCIEKGKGGDLKGREGRLETFQCCESCDTITRNTIRRFEECGHSIAVGEATVPERMKRVKKKPKKAMWCRAGRRGASLNVLKAREIMHVRINF